MYISNKNIQKTTKTKFRKEKETTAQIKFNKQKQHDKNVWRLLRDEQKDVSYEL